MLWMAVDVMAPVPGFAGMRCDDEVALIARRCKEDEVGPRQEGEERERGSAL